GGTGPRPAPPRAAPCRRGAGGIVYYRMSSGRPDHPRNLFGVRQEDSSCGHCAKSASGCSSARSRRASRTRRR
ncbi:hypothetical protein GRT45_33010, partial [Burkholderia pseudomallei]|nr:hypothetical protein [Burkholderia pseudomallei]